MAFFMPKPSKHSNYPLDKSVGVLIYISPKIKMTQEDFDALKSAQKVTEEWLENVDNYVTIKNEKKGRYILQDEDLRFNGTFAVINEMTNTRLMTKHLRHGFAILSAFRLNDYDVIDGEYIDRSTRRSLEKNRKDNEELRRVLKEKKLRWIPVVGGFIEAGTDVNSLKEDEGFEESTLVFMYNFEEDRWLEEDEVEEFCKFIMHLGYKYNQDVVMIKRPDENVGQFYNTSPKNKEAGLFQKTNEVTFSRLDFTTITDEFFTCIAKDIKDYIHKRKENIKYNKKNPQNPQRNLGFSYRESFGTKKQKLIFVEAYVPLPSGNISGAYIRKLSGEYPVFGSFYSFV